MPGLETESNTFDEFHEKWVRPHYAIGWVGNDASAFRTALAEVNPSVVDRLLSYRDWRQRIVGSWFAGLKQWTQFEHAIGRQFLAGNTTYAGAGYAFALACFADPASRDYLTAYLNRYLRQRDKFYDQDWAMPALMWIDAQCGTQDSAPYLAPGGLWESYTKGKNDAWRIENCRDRFWRLMQYCRAEFDAPYYGSNEGERIGQSDSQSHSAKSPDSQLQAAA